mgnify:CR=1 FL=1
MALNFFSNDLGIRKPRVTIGTKGIKEKSR